MKTDRRSALEVATMRKMMLRIVPLLALGAVFQAFSQLNVSFAGLQMTTRLGFTSAQFGFGSGIFFLSYLVLGVPANLLLLRFGAKVWISLAMFSWGLLSASLSLTTTPTSFYLLRLLLGAAEAGFIPGILFIAGTWFPEEYRGRILAFLLVCNPISAMIGGPLSGYLLQLDGVAGLAGWQWVFIVEGLPASLLAVLVFMLLPRSLDQIPWLESSGREWLMERLHSEKVHVKDPERFTAAALIDSRVLVLSVIFLGASALPFGLIFFIPKIIQSFGASEFQSALLSALPFACGAMMMLVWGRSSDRNGERLFHALGALALAIGGCAMFLLTKSPLLGMISLCLTFAGTFAFVPIFWTMPNKLLGGAVAATGVAIINGMGGVSGIVAPTIMGALKDLTGAYNAGVACVMAVATASGIVLFFYGRRHQLDLPSTTPLA